jgi:hypothetical protein
MELLAGLLLFFILWVLGKVKLLPDVSPVPRGRDLRAAIREEKLPEDYYTR